MHTPFGWPSRAMVVAAIALFAALGGSGYAATTIHTASASHHARRGPRGPRGFTGARGPIGPAGQTGSTGPQGPAGADGSQLKAANVRTVYGPETIVPVNQVRDVFAHCAADERVVGGGFLEPNNNTNAGGGWVLDSAPAPSAPTSDWFVRFLNSNSSFQLSVQASAVCVKAG